MNKYLENKRVYLSGAIEKCNSLINWRTAPSEILVKEFGINLFDPFADPKQQKTTELREARKNRDFNKIIDIAKSFVRKDLSLVDRSDLVIAYLDSNLPTCGTHHEIVNSSMSKKPTLLVSRTGDILDIPTWYFGFINMKYMFSNWDELYKYLREVNEGKHKDDFRWSFVYDLI